MLRVSSAYCRWEKAVAAVEGIVDSLSREDQVNIVCARGSYIDSDGNSITERFSVLGCNANQMMRATVSNRQILLDRVRVESPRGSGADHE